MHEELYVFVLVRKFGAQQLNDEIIEGGSFIEGVFTSIEEANNYLLLSGAEYENLCWHKNVHMKQPMPLYTRKIVDGSGHVCWFILFPHEVNPHKASYKVFAQIYC